MEADDPPPVTDVQAALLNQAEELRKKRDAERAFLSRRELKKARKKLSNLYRRVGLHGCCGGFKSQCNNN
jgi:hypothetical protein